MASLRRIANWFEERLQIRGVLADAALHPVPMNSASWWYVFGTATLTCFAVLLVTGVCLTLVYVPAGDKAWQSLEVLNYQIPFGWYLRAVHYWASNFMVALLIVHVLQVFLFGAYKYPRELTWVVGVFLLLLTLANAFTGQIMRFDQDAYWGIGIGVAITGRIPIVGPALVHILLGGPIIGGRTLSRFFAIHVFLVPAAILALVALHLRLVLKLGINEPPVPGRVVRKATYRQEYEEELQRDGVPFFPDAAWRDIVFSGLVLLGILGAAALFGPKGPGGAPDPTQIHTVPRPDFYFLWLFAALALLPPGIETVVMLVAPIVLVAALIAVPFLFGTGEKSPRRRPVAMLCMVSILVVLGVLTRYGETSPWSPVMQAWSAMPTPTRYLKGRSPLELQGALLVQEKQCRNCHRLGGRGGARGPALDDVATRLTRNELIRQVLQGGGNMPAYGKHLSPPEVTALVAFLETLHPPGEPPQRTADVSESAPVGSPAARTAGASAP